MLPCNYVAGHSKQFVLCVQSVKYAYSTIITHSDNENFFIQCGLQECKRIFTNFHTFKNHVHPFHDVSAIDEEEHESPTTRDDDDFGDERLSLGTSKSSSPSLEYLARSQQHCGF